MNFNLQEQWFPLFLLTGGIILTIELEPTAELVMNSGQVWTSASNSGFSGADFTISDMKFIGRLIQGSEELRDTYYTMFKGDGLYYTYSNILWYEHSSDSTSQAQQQNVGKRMVRWIATMIKDARHIGAYTDDANYDTALNYDSLATGLRAELIRYDYSALSMRYPLDSQVDIENDRFLAQPLLFFEQVFGSTIHRFSPQQWASLRADLDTRFESQRFYPCALLSKTNEDFMGLDLINTPIQCNFSFSGEHAPTDATAVARRYFYNFVEYDCIALFQQNHGVQVMA